MTTNRLSQAGDAWTNADVLRVGAASILLGIVAAIFLADFFAWLLS